MRKARALIKSVASPLGRHKWTSHVWTAAPTRPPRRPLNSCNSVALSNPSRNQGHGLRAAPPTGEREGARERAPLLKFRPGLLFPPRPSLARSLSAASHWKWPFYAAKRPHHASAYSAPPYLRVLSLPLRPRLAVDSTLSGVLGAHPVRHRHYLPLEVEVEGCLPASASSVRPSAAAPPPPLLSLAASITENPFIFIPRRLMASFVLCPHRPPQGQRGGCEGRTEA